MARIKLTIPGQIIATLHIPVRITDINYGNHLGNDAIISIIHESRVQWLGQHQYTELNIEGIGLIMSNLAVEYVNESFYGDLLQIQMAIGEVSSVAFELYYNVLTTREEKTIVIAKAKTGMVCFNYAEKKVALIPGKLKELLKA